VIFAGLPGSADLALRMPGEPDPVSAAGVPDEALAQPCGGQQLQ